MYDLTIVGSGFWGVVTSLFAKEVGLNFVLIDDKQPHSGSRNASGLIDTSWYKGNFFDGIKPDWWDPKLIDIGIKKLLKFGVIKETIQDDLHVSGKRKGERRTRKVYIVSDLIGLLNTDFPRIYGSLTSLKKVDYGWYLNDLGVQCKNVVLTTGMWTDGVLESSGIPKIGVKGLAGRAIFIKTKEKLERPLRTLRGSFDHTIFRPWTDDQIRVGDTVEEVLKQKNLDKLVQESERIYPDLTVVKDVIGFRPVCNKVFVEKIADNLVVATGAHRVGLGLAPVIAERSLKLLDMLKE